MKLAEELGRSRDEVSSHHHKVERPQRAGWSLRRGCPGEAKERCWKGKERMREVPGTLGNKFGSHLHGEVGSAG